ncbi:hypothetical protein BS47DRAFT_1370413 [Hydnum rufescens UP504]|uniref:tRNA pseudouridine(55) synthase n=1 Tax=Hydnum rufescens UP504 TaxID=1448309 RepID=A0A9P6BAJ7_9AGAM|nr:hypothetical protein BS47DRAFT_1370413 [Hydnum rufescens UP504]
MPKALSPLFPLEGLFALIKPSGPASMILLDRLKPLFNESPLFRKRRKDAVKIGQGGTLDPLADGVLVIGVNKGTKSLANFLNCTKEYYTTALLGCETDSYDSQGARVRTAPFSHVTREMISGALGSFRGEISQLPPIYSALKMDGKPLYEYARNGLALPRPIEPRKVTIHSLELVDWKEGRGPGIAGHNFKWPEKTLNAEDIAAIDRIRMLVAEAASGPPAFTLKMVVSSGTYVRSIVHDLAHAIGSAAHVVTLTRTRQGDFGVGPNDDLYGGDCVPWEVFEKALEDRDRETHVADGEHDEWEKVLLAKWHPPS